jgi:hypothetical protein
MKAVANLKAGNLITYHEIPLLLASSLVVTFVGSLRDSLHNSDSVWLMFTSPAQQKSSTLQTQPVEGQTRGMTSNNKSIQANCM